MWFLKASKSPGPFGAHQRELNIAGLESSEHNRPFAPFGYILKVFLFTLSWHYVTCFIISISWDKYSLAFSEASLLSTVDFFFFHLESLSRGDTPRVLSSTHSVPMSTQAASRQVSFARFHTFEQKKGSLTYTALNEMYQNSHIPRSWPVRGTNP